MIEKSRFLDKIRELGYTHKRTHRNNQFYRKRGGDHRDHMIIVPRRGAVAVEYAKRCLEEAGCSPDEIKSFLTDF